MTKNNTDVEKAAQLIKQSEQKKVEACSQELSAVLQKHGCIMQAQVVIRGQQIVSQVLIVPNPNPNQPQQMQFPKDGSEPT